MATELNTRPAELVGITEPALALAIDRAVFAGGQAIDAEVRRAEQEAIKAKRTPDQVASAASAALRRCLAPPRPAPRRAGGDRPEVIGARYSLAGGRFRVLGLEYAGAEGKG